VIENDNIYAVQFHPEKSGPVGLKVVSNFVTL
jgi:imidazole glycerol-phosphate synthase subunit HisH